MQIKEHKMMRKTRILLGISGSISAYKAADLTNELTKLGYEVDVLMTQHSQAFITPLTLQSLSKRSVHVDVMSEHNPQSINHIELAKQADLFLVAPATANIIAKLANGIADDLLTTVALALDQTIPKMIAPAMNTKMYLHPLTQKNIQQLKDIGYQEIEPRQALLACGDFGPGALATIETILSHVEAIVSTH
jgi:phosphopantothenoylcysteine decarboxylase